MTDCVCNGDSTKYYDVFEMDYVDKKQNVIYDIMHIFGQKML
jgi:hypothetical protein